MIIRSLVTVGAVHTHTHTHTDASLKNEIMPMACKCFFAGFVFCIQNLIRDG